MWPMQSDGAAYEFISNLSTKDAIEYLLIVAGFGWGLFLQWRYAQHNLFERLENFIEKEDTRLDKARLPIISQIRRPEPQRFAYEPIYSNKSLSRALKEIGLQKFGRAEKRLASSVSQIKERLQLCEKNLTIQKEQLATAHLALGAIAASKSEHALALSEFQKAGKLHRSSPEFLEHIGLQLVKVGNPEEARTSFESMREIADDVGDNLAKAWSYRHEAYAHWNSPQKSAWQAQTSLNQAIQAFPDHAPPMDVASTWELHGKMRKERGQLSPAKQSFTNALVIYAGQRHQPDGEACLSRVQEQIAMINNEIAAGAQIQTDDDGPDPSPSGSIKPSVLDEQNCQTS